MPTLQRYGEEPETTLQELSPKLPSDSTNGLPPQQLRENSKQVDGFTDNCFTLIVPWRCKKSHNDVEYVCPSVWGAPTVCGCHRSLLQEQS